MQELQKRLQALRPLARSLILTFLGVACLAIAAAYFFIIIERSMPVSDALSIVKLHFLPMWARGAIFLLVGVALVLAGVWRLSSVVVFPLEGQARSDSELVLGYARERTPPNVVVFSGGAGLLILASLGRQATSLTCITPVQDPVEYYYRASSLFHFEKVIFVVPTPAPLGVEARLDDGTCLDIRQNISHDDTLVQRHVADLRLVIPPGAETAASAVTRVTLDALNRADVIIFGPGSLFESILPNLLLPGVREAIQRSKARKIYICSLMTEPGLTTGFGVAEHIRQIQRFGGFTLDYVLVNAQRIESEVRQIYAAAHQQPVFLTPEDYEETMVTTTDRVTEHDVVLEGAIVIEADLASSVFQLTASLDNPGESRSVRVLRHDPDKLYAAIVEVLRRG